MANYERLGTQLPESALFTCVVAYPATPFAAGTIQHLCTSPFDGRIVRVDMINNTTITTESAVELKIDGGAALDTLTTGDEAIGSIDSFVPAVNTPILTGETLTATGDGGSSAGDVLMVVTLQKTPVS